MRAVVSRETLLTHFADELFAANKETNLVSRRLGRDDIRAMVHSFARTLDVVGAASPDGVLDIGTGAGLPGIPLAITYPSTRVVLAERRRLRVAWLGHIVAELGLDNTSVLEGRAEDFPELEDAFPAVTAFGVGPSADAIALCCRFLAPGGVAAVSAPAMPEPADESRWLLAAAVNGAVITHLPDALAGGRALLKVQRDG